MPGKEKTGVHEVKALALEAVAAQQRAGADEATASASQSDVTELSYNGGKYSMLRSVHANALSLKFIKDQKQGSAAVNGYAEGLVDEAVASAKASAEEGQADPAYGIAEKTENRVVQQGCLEPDKEQMFERLDAFLKEVKRRYPQISFDSFGLVHQRSIQAFANSAGVLQIEESGSYHWGGLFMAVEGTKTSSFNHFSIDSWDLDHPLLELGAADRIFDELRRQIYPEQLKGQFRGDLIIQPDCLTDFLDSIDALCLSDGSLMSQTSPWKEALEMQVADSSFTWTKAPGDPRLVGSPFTREGYLAEERSVIEAGVLKSFSLGRYGAKKTGGKRAANNSGNDVVAPGHLSKAALIEGVERGLLLSRFSGGSPSPDGELSGVAKNSFLIEDGRIGAAVQECMLQLDLSRLLSQITGISTERECCGSQILPWIRFKDVLISGS